jgi:hypothetical protein
MAIFIGTSTGCIFPQVKDLLSESSTQYAIYNIPVYFTFDPGHWLVCRNFKVYFFPGGRSVMRIFDPILSLGRKSVWRSFDPGRCCKKYGETSTQLQGIFFPRYTFLGRRSAIRIFDPIYGTCILYTILDFRPCWSKGLC